MGSAGRRVLYRGVLVVAATLLTLAGVECVLRLLTKGAVDRLLASRRHGAAPDASTVLCVGDSFTFGWFYRSEEAYPARLEQLLRAGAPATGVGAAHWFVENAGIPAQNLSQIADRLGPQLDRLQPKVVVILGGFNDRWNVAAPRERGRLHELFAQLVLVKLVRLVITADAESPPDGRNRFQTFSRTQVTVEGGGDDATIDVKKVGKGADDGTDNAEPDDEETNGSDPGDSHESSGVGQGRGGWRALANRLERIVNLVKSHGALPLLLSYPAPESKYEPPSHAAAFVAEHMHVPFVDLHAAFAEQLTIHRYEELLIPNDRHPTDRGHWRMAVLVASALAEHGIWSPPPELRAALIEAPRHDFAVAGFPELLHPVELSPLADGAWQLRGPPLAHWRVLIAASDTPSHQFGNLTVPLAADAVFARAGGDDRFESDFDATGSTRFSIPEGLAADARFIALAVLHDPMLNMPDLRVRAIVGPLRLR